MTAADARATSQSLDCDLPATVYAPDERETAPGLVLLHGSGAEPMDDLARGLAADGFATAAVQYWGDADGVPDDLSEVPVEGVLSAAESLADHDAVAGETVGLYGASKGGELALLAATHADRVDAVVGVSPSCYVWEGLRQDWRPTGTSSWSLDGEPVPYVPFADAESPDGAIRGFYEVALERADSETVEAATIPVERIDAPVMLVSGGDDRMWPSAEFADAAMDRFDAHREAHPHRHRSYEDAGHVFGPPGEWIDHYDERDFARLGGTRAAMHRACEDSWPEVQSFLRANLEA